MKNRIGIVALALAFTNILNAQNVGINSTGAAPNASAMLDVSSTSKGLLIPNVTLTSTTSNAPIGASVATSLMVYNTTAAGSGSTAVYPGYYYWDGTKWVSLGGGSGGKDWSITGNAGTTPSSAAIGSAVNNNFIGTTDNQDFVVATNNLEVARFFKSPTENMVVNSITAVTNDIFSSYSSTAAGNAIAGYHTYTGTSGGNGIYGTTSADNGNGVKGKSTTVTTSTTVIPTGVYGQAAAIHGIGVYGQNTHASGTGVVGAGNGLSSIVPASGAGGSFYSTNYGVYSLLAPSTTLTTASAIYSDGASKGYAGIFMNGEVGIGTAAPTYLLHVVGAAPSSLGTLSEIDNTSSGDAIDAFCKGALSYACLFGNNNPSGNGSSFSILSSNAAVQGQIGGSQQYSFGVFGNNPSATIRNGGVIGEVATTIWTCSGYINSGGTYYALFSQNGASVLSNRLSSSAGAHQPASGIGAGINSGFMGAWINGDKYGLHIKGDRYASYSQGKTFSTDVAVTLTTVEGKEKRVPSFASASMSADVIVHGRSSLVNGKTHISFDDNFSSIISSTTPVVVTITPNGKSYGVYVDNVTSTGFDVIENNDGASSVSFNWIAIGARKESENIEIPAELLSNDYDQNMGKVMHNENNTGEDASPIWWDGSKLRFDKEPDSLKPLVGVKTKNSTPKN